MAWKIAIKKPIVIKYREVNGDREIIKTREGTLTAVKDRDFIICGVEGEIYPIDKVIFAKTYDVSN